MNVKPYVTAIIVAAGNSTRMGGAVSKQFIPLLGKPVIAYTLNAFESAMCIDEIVVVCRQCDMAQIKEIAEKENCTKVRAFAFGGETRSDSVRAGIDASNPSTTHFAIHDGARPLVLPEEIENVVSVAISCKAATLAVNVVDTVKVVNEQGYIVSTPDRSSLRAAQTPQVFEKALYLKALEFTKGSVFTDDCALVETVGAKVKAVSGNLENIKVTTPLDVLLAEVILNKRKGN